LTPKYKVTNDKEIIISNDIKETYCQKMKSLQFGNYEIPSYHSYVKNNVKLNQSAIMRALSEISGFKSDLPLNWESSIWVRVSKTRFNIFSFLISGPKDTPYENGLFEFHAYFPIDFPNTVPEVIIHTTGNGKFRFNPNLYANGKVCLSLLGTWQGLDSEKWNPKTSTFLQVMISIQSLILVEQPYFNEPGLEKEMNTSKGVINSDNYNKNIHPNTIMLGMINMIKNPPQGFEQVVNTHFIMKKEEIIKTTLEWEENATTNKEIIAEYRKELIQLLKSCL
jgi:baculoviral IAP repeat-containing protein 6